MPVQQSGRARGDDCFGQTDLRIAMNPRVHQLADDGAVFGRERFDTGVAALVHSVILTEALS